MQGRGSVHARVRSVHDETLEKNTCNLLPDDIILGLGKHVQQRAAEEVRVRVGVPKLVRNGVDKQVPGGSNASWVVSCERVVVVACCWLWGSASRVLLVVRVWWWL
jgi:hypothetical protein